MKQVELVFCRDKENKILDTLDESIRDELIHLMAKLIAHYFKRGGYDNESELQDNAVTLE